MDKYYQLLDANSANVSSLWKVMHVAAMLFATISGFIAAYTLGKAIDAFNNHCILFAHIVFLDNSTLPTLSNAMRELPDYFHEINMPETDWGKISECYFCQFTPVMSMISGLIWGAFFIICSKGGAGYISDSIYRPWRIVYPAIVFAIITVGLLLLSTLELSSGINTFCAQFKDIFNTTECTNYIDEYTLLFSDTQKPLIIFLRVSLIASIICLVCWIAQLITLILRIVCVADFEMFKITVTFPNDSQESLQGIIDPDNISIMDDNISSTSKTSITSKKSNYKRRFLKLSPLGFLKKIYKYKRSSSADQYDMDILDVISLHEPSTSSKIDIDKTSIKSPISPDAISTASHDKGAKRVGFRKQTENSSYFEDTVYSSLFFAKRKKHAKEAEDTVIRESLSFVPHSNESLLSNMLYSNQDQNNPNILENQIEIDNSESNVFQQNPSMSSAPPNNSIIESYSSIENTNRYQSFGFVDQQVPLSNDNLEIKLIEQKSDADLEIVHYDHRTYSPYTENIDEEVTIDIINKSSNENFVNSRNRTAIRPIQRGHVNFIPVNEETNIPATSSPILNYETINSNNYIHDSNTELGLTRDKHQTGHSQNIPYTLQRNTEESEEIPPHEFREEPRYETNTAQDSRNDVREVLVRMYVVLWLAVVLRNISSLV